ncbi:hypothetical protein [Paraglaciecola sp.]|uniref:hypothetical protein n=1 Tax=Paraglaciecola sp. TaxID=1920173 RepID=UPI003EF9EBE1
MSLTQKFKNVLNIFCCLAILLAIAACGQKQEIEDNGAKQGASSIEPEPVTELPPSDTAKAPPVTATPEPIVAAPQPVLSPPTSTISSPSITPLPGDEASDDPEFGGNRDYSPTFPIPSKEDKNPTHEYYSVVVSGSKQLQLPGNKGLLNVWIGDEEFKPKQTAKMNYADTNIAAVGQFALVEANAPDFDVSPVSSRCLLLHPSGVDAKFNLTATQAGNFVVSATVNLFNTEDCTGPAIPKTANTLEVNVDVNEAFLDDQRRKNFEDTFWTKALEFWGALLALLFGLVLFLVRKQLKKWFGYEKSES